MSGDQLEGRILKWLDVHFPSGQQWQSREFDCMRSAPSEFRVVTFTRELEGQISNGGLAQLLWNTFFHWRELLDTCAEGYFAMGAVKEAASVKEYAKLFEANEDECRQWIQKAAELKRGAFDGWYESAESRMSAKSEKLFYSDARVSKTRQRWLEENENVIMRLLEGTHHTA